MGIGNFCDYLYMFRFLTWSLIVGPVEYINVFRWCLVPFIIYGLRYAKRSLMSWVVIFFFFSSRCHTNRRMDGMTTTQDIRDLFAYHGPYQLVKYLLTAVTIPDKIAPALRLKHPHLFGRQPISVRKFPRQGLLQWIWHENNPLCSSGSSSVYGVMLFLVPKCLMSIWAVLRSPLKINGPWIWSVV